MVFFVLRDTMPFLCLFSVLYEFDKNANSIMNKLKITNFLMLTVAGIVNAFGITVFLMPVKLYDSGISGTSILLDQLNRNI